jgi:DNA-directed RNA polymerase specialized sigma24 family protein
MRLAEKCAPAEIAAELGMSIANVYTSCSRVSKKVREILAQFGEDLDDEDTPVGA